MFLEVRIYISHFFLLSPIDNVMCTVLNKSKAIQSEVERYRSKRRITAYPDIFRGEA